MQVFVSHSGVSPALAQQAAGVLRKHDLNTWLAEDNLLPGDNIYEEIAKALKASDAMLVLVSPDAKDSTNASAELGYALGGRQFSHRVFPVVVGTGQVGELPDAVPWVLRSMVQYAKAREVKATVEGIARQLLGTKSGRLLPV